MYDGRDEHLCRFINFVFEGCGVFVARILYKYIPRYLRQFIECVSVPVCVRVRVIFVMYTGVYFLFFLSENNEHVSDYKIVEFKKFTASHLPIETFLLLTYYKSVLLIFFFCNICIQVTLYFCCIYSGMN